MSDKKGISVIIVKYTDGDTMEYSDIEDAEIGILEVFSGSDNNVTPVAIQEYGEDELFICAYACRWSVQLVVD